MLALILRAFCMNLQQSNNNKKKKKSRTEIVGCFALRVFRVYFILDCVHPNRVSVSRAIKPFAESGRPPDWFSQKV